MGILIELDNLKEWTKEYTLAFKPCFYEPYSMKYLKKFANDRFQNIVDEQGLELTDKEFKKCNKEFVEYFIDEMVRLIDLDKNKTKNKEE